MTLFFKGLLSTRYDITTEGLNEIDVGQGGILFLPNHPGYTDPAIQYTNLYWRFKAQPVGYEDEVNRKGIFGLLIRRTNPLSVPKIEAADAEQGVENLAHSIADALREGRNILMYPEGQLSRTPPDLNGKSLVERILKIYPQARIVLSQMNGHLGSSSGAVVTGDFPDLGTLLPRRMMDLAAAGLFFMPKRPIHVKYLEVTADFPRTGTRQQITDYLGQYYRDGLLPPRYVRYRNSEPNRIIDLPYPAMPVTSVSDTVADVSADVRKKVIDKISELTGVAAPKDGDDLAATLGMDSLDQQSLNLWIETEFKTRNNAPIKTVTEALLVASGKQATTGTRVRPPSGPWVRDQGKGDRLMLPAEATDLLAAFRYQVANHPDQVIVTDETSGPKTYRDLALAIRLMVPRFKKLEGQYIGVLLPGSVGEVVAYYSLLFAGKTPVVINFTAGEAKVKWSLDSLACKSIVTSRTFLDRLRDTKGISFDTLEDRFLTFERVREGITASEQLMALLWSEKRGFWQDLPHPNLGPKSQSVVLFTSGSKSNPKAVPYTHEMETVSIGDVAIRLALTDRDRLMSIAPPFHSLGHRLMTTGVSLRIPQVFHTDPTDGATIAKISEMYRPTLIVGTPTFLRGIAWSAEGDQLDSYRVAVVGAEKLTDDVIDILAAKAKNMVVLEGYGLTELAPTVCVNPAEAPRRGSIGTALDSVIIRIVDPDNFAIERPVGANGMMLVAAKDPARSSVMSGYLNYDGTQPFVVIDGVRWFVTGDLIERLPDGYYKFISRLERSIKIGGEMVPLDGLEETLQTQPLFISGDVNGGQTVAIEATAVDVNPELVLFTTVKDVTPEIVNPLLRAAGWSKTFKISKIIWVAEIPQLGTGKINRNPLRELLK